MVGARIVAVQEGHFGDWKAIDRTVSELRVHAGPGYRIIRFSNFACECFVSFSQLRHDHFWSEALS